MAEVEIQHFDSVVFFAIIIILLLLILLQVNQKSFNKKLKKCRDDSCKSKRTRWDDSCKSKGTRWDALAKVRHAQVSHALR